MSETNTTQTVRIKKSTYLALRKRQKIKVISKVALLILLVFCIAFIVVMANLKVLPAKYLLIMGAVLVVILFLCAIPLIKKRATNRSRQVQSFICILLSVLMLVGCIYVPVQKGKIQALFTPVPTTGTMNINIYTLKTSDITEVQQLAAKTVALQSKLDTEYQNWAVKVINKEITGQDIGTQNYDSIYDAAQALYNGNVMALMLNESYVEILCDNDNYSDFLEKTNLVYQCSQTIKLDYNTTAVSDVTTKPFTILIAGQDSTNYNNISAEAKTRSDVVMVLTVNPVTKQVLVVTIPRDYYVALSGNINHMDKITHASVLGIGCLSDTVSSLLSGVDINYFLRINFQSFVEIVNAVGGVTVDNPYYFCMTYKKNKTQNYCYDKGTIEMDGAHALGYVRERKYSDKNVTINDQGRNKHQALVIKALMQKATSVAIITQISAILDGLKGTFTTSMTSDDIFALAQMQLDDMADWEVLSYSITGKLGGTYEPSYVAGGQLLSVVHQNAEENEKAAALINSILSGKTLTKADVEQ
jgi:LCP family protein required for cell wall assembly